MLDQGFLASTIFYSMYAHTKNHVDAYIAAADMSFAVIARDNANGTLRGQLRGAPATSGFKRLV